MIGIADPKLWNLGVGLLPKWSGLLFIIYRIFTFKYSIPGQNKISIFCFVLRPVTLPQPGLGRIAEQVQVLVA